MKKNLALALAFAVLATTAAAQETKKKEEKKMSGNPVVVVKTSLGTFKAEIYSDKAPVSAKNFLQYVSDKYYDGTVWHRVIPTFMIQGGGFDKDLNKRETRAPIANEASNGLSNTVGTLAMARTNDPNSATSQFFVNVKDNLFLDKARSGDGVGYAVFGKVTEGMDVVNKIKDVPTGMKNGMGDVPQTPVIIESIRVQ